MDALATGNGITINYKVYEDWAQIFEALEGEEIDLIPNMGVTERRRDKFSFSLSVETFHVSIFTRKKEPPITGLDVLDGKSVAVVSMNVGEVLVKGANPKEILTYDHIQDALFSLLSGNADALIYPEPVLLLYARRMKVDNRLKIDGLPLTEIKRAMSVRRGNEHILEWLNPRIEAFIQTKEYRDIYARWYGTPTPYWNGVRVLIAMSLLLMAVIIILEFWKYTTTEKIVALRTEELSRKAQLLNQVGDSVVTLDESGKILSCNPGMEKQFLFRGDELNAMDIFDLLVTENPDMERIVKERNENIGESSRHWEVAFQRKNGTLFSGEISLSRLYDKNMISVGYIGIIHDISERKNLEAKRESLISELKKALNEIKELSGLLPICSSCKKIRDDKGYWNQLETYFSEHSDVVFSHGLCPECLEKYYGKLSREVEDD